MITLKTLIIILGLFAIHASYATFNVSRKHVIVAQLFHAGLICNDRSRLLPVPLHEMIAHFSDDGEKLRAYNFINNHLMYDQLTITNSNSICGYNDHRCKVECDSHGNVIEIKVSVCV